MSKQGWSFGNRLMESFFKRSPDGWLFATPYVWPRQTYLVTDEQKAKLLEPLRRMWWAQMLVSIVGVIVLLKLLEDRPLLLWTPLGIEVVAIFILSSVYSVIAVRPLLAGVPATNERITFSDRFNARAMALPKAFFVVGALFSLLMFAVGLFLGLFGTWDLTEILSTVFFGALTLLYVAFFFVRQRAKPQM